MRKKIVFMMCFCLLMGLLSACKKDSESSSPAATAAQTTSETTNGTTNVAGQISQSGYKEEKIELPKENGRKQNPEIIMSQGKIELFSKMVDEKTDKTIGYYKNVLQNDKTWVKEEPKWSSKVAKENYFFVNNFVPDNNGNYYAVAVISSQNEKEREEKVDMEKLTSSVLKLNADGSVQKLKFDKIKAEKKEEYVGFIESFHMFSDETMVAMMSSGKYYLYDMKTGKMIKEYQETVTNNNLFFSNNSILTLNETKNAVKVIDKDTEQTTSEIPLKADKSITINEESSYALTLGPDDTCYLISENGIMSASDSDTEYKSIVEKGKLSAYLLNDRYVTEFMVGNNNDFYYAHVKLSDNDASSDMVVLDHVYSEGK